MSHSSSYQVESLENRLLLASVPSGFSDHPVASGLVSPTAMALAPDGRIFVAQQSGAVRVIKNGQLLSTPFVTLSNVNSEEERGFLGIELDPDFNSNHYVYVYYTTDDNGAHNRVARLTADGDVAESGSQENLVDLPPINGAVWHMGGALHFGNDGKLYVAVGDHLFYEDDKLQTLETPFGKILRFNSDGSIPTDNPWYDEASGINRAAWAMGFRNPFTFGFDPQTGKMLVDDVGQETWEEINLGAAGANYGWPDSEGPQNTGGFTAPIYYYNHSEGLAITAGVFYRPAVDQFPSSYEGKFFFADLVSGWVRVLDLGNNTASNFATGLQGPVDMDVAADGTLYYLQRGSNINQGSVGRITFGDISSGEKPIIVTQPSSKTVRPGQDATFSVVAAGEDLRYQWIKNGHNIGGSAAKNSTFTINDAESSDAGTYRVRVVNDNGDVLSRAISLTVNSSKPPVAKISSPASGTKFRDGQTITFQGSGTDAEDGTLSASRMTWQVDYITGSVVRPFVAAKTGISKGKFVIPVTSPYTKTDVRYRIRLTVRDSDGGTDTETRDIVPLTSTIKLSANISGVSFEIDGQPKASGASTSAVEGMLRTITAPEEVTVSGQTYVFSKWSDGGQREHEISIPASDTTFTATYRKQFSVNDTLNLAPSDDAYVIAGSASNNYGTSRSLHVLNDGTAKHERLSYLRFDLGDLTSTIKDAKLRLWGRVSASTDQNLKISAYAAGNSVWSEHSINWSNKPAISGSALGTVVINDKTGQYYEFDLTNFLESQRKAGRTSVTIALRLTSKVSSYAVFNSKESNDNRPELSISI